MKKLPIILSLFAVILLSACNGEKEVKKERSVGGTSEILVVSQTLEQWEGAEGNAIRGYFTQEQYGLPQSEPIYKVTHVNANKFSDMFKKHKCILVIETDPGLAVSKIEKGADMWAAPQCYIKITAANDASWVETFEKNKEAIKSLFDKAELDRIMSILRPSTNTEIYKSLDKQFGIKMSVPEGFFVAKQEKDFVWLRKELDKSGAGIMVYSEDYTDTTQFELNSIITKRNIITQKYIAGPTEGSYMTTESEFVPPVISDSKTFDAGYAAEVRGMWCLVGDYMAGPFVSYTFVNENTHKLITAEGYVYAPNQDKRNLLLQLQAIICDTKIQASEQQQ